MEVVLVCLGAFFLAADIAATWVVMRMEQNATRRRFQLLFVWLVPMFGAIVTIGIHRDSISSQGQRVGANPDELFSYDRGGDFVSSDLTPSHEATDVHDHI